MLGVARLLVLAAAGLATAGCITDGMVGDEADAAAKPRVIDTPKTRIVSSKKDAEKLARATEQGDTAARMTVARVDPQAPTSPAPQAPAQAAAPAPAIPASSLFGNWTLVDSGGQKCRVILGGVLIGTSYSARGEADCPRAFSSVQSWEIQGDELVLRNQARTVVGRLQPTGPFRFDGQGDGMSVYLIR
jgi:hypothetical protein